MYANELKSKLAAENQYGTQAQGLAGDACGVTDSIRIPLETRLRQRIGEAESARKALRILEAHPEFEDLLWLLRSELI